MLGPRRRSFSWVLISTLGLGALGVAVGVSSGVLLSMGDSCSPEGNFAPCGPGEVAPLLAVALGFLAGAAGLVGSLTLVLGSWALESIRHREGRRLRPPTLLLGSAVSGALVLTAAFGSYRLAAHLRTGNCPQGAADPTPVLVAKTLIRRGTPGTVIATRFLYVATTFPCREVVSRSLSDPGWLNGRVATLDIFPGSQLTSQDFALAKP